MSILEELDRIQKAGVSITIRWNRSVRFIALLGYDATGKPRYNVNFSRLMKKSDKDFNSTIYNAILEFDDKHPEYL